MNVILLERVNNLGDLGDEVSVKAGFARNFLLPKKKAVQANDANRAVFEEKRKELEDAANEKLASLMSGVQETSTTTQKDIKTTIPISTPDIAKKNLEKPSKGAASPLPL